MSAKDQQQTAGVRKTREPPVSKARVIFIFLLYRTFVLCQVLALINSAKILSWYIAMRIILTLSVLFSTIIVQIMGTFNFLSSPFRIRELDIPGRLLLAPMDGFTDSPFRRICREFGASLLTSEFINGIDLMYGHPHLKYKTFFHASERPFAFQVFDDEPERLLSSALKLQELAPDLIDINMGCSAKSVSNRGAGAGLLKHPEKIK